MPMSGLLDVTESPPENSLINGSNKQYPKKCFVTDSTDAVIEVICTIDPYKIFDHPRIHRTDYNKRWI
jgi:hypothetical protein